MSYYGGTVTVAGRNLITSLMAGKTIEFTRIMVGSGLAMALVFVLGLFYSFRNEIAEKAWYLRLAVLALPLPWIASEAGWFVAEYGRQPWAIYNVLP